MPLHPTMAMSPPEPGSGVPVHESTVQLGLLAEAIEAQRTTVATALERLQEHTRGLDTIVREEIRATLIEEWRGLAEDSSRAADALRNLKRAASLRFAAWTVALMTLAVAIPLGLTWWMVPTRTELEGLRRVRDELSANVAQLSAQGGGLQLRRCGAAQRLCVRVDRSAPSYGEGADYLVVKGY